MYDLTDYQIFEVYFHARDDKDGSIKLPSGAEDWASLHIDKPPELQTYDDELTALFQLGAAIKMDLKSIDALKQQLDAKYGVSNDAGAATSAQ